MLDPVFPLLQVWHDPSIARPVEPADAGVLDGSQERLVESRRESRDQAAQAGSEIRSVATVGSPVAVNDESSVPGEHFQIPQELQIKVQGVTLAMQDLATEARKLHHYLTK